MFLSGEGIDEILIELYKNLDENGDNNVGTRGDMLEILGVSFRMKNPRARISRSQDRGKPFSALGELIWYLAGLDSLEFIKEYIPIYEKDAENGVIYGAYGPRIFSMRGNINQLDNVIDQLSKNSTSKRAVIQLYDAVDIIERHKEIPCTTAIQFLIRDGRLYTSVTMRSNDAYKGLPHDVFCFTMLQEMLATRLGVEVGEYIHYAASMHTYDCSIDAMKTYINEGHQKTVQMPVMPSGNPFSLTNMLMAAEADIRAGGKVRATDYTEDPYWADIIRLLQVYWATKGNNQNNIGELDLLESEFHDGVYRTYLDRRRKRIIQKSNNKGSVN